MNPNLIYALEMLGQGMLGIFVVLGLIALFVVLLRKLDGGKKLSSSPEKRALYSTYFDAFTHRHISRPPENNDFL